MCPLCELRQWRRTVSPADIPQQNIIVFVWSRSGLVASSLQLQLYNEQFLTCGLSDFDAFVFGCVSADDAVASVREEESLLFAALYACIEM